MLEIRRLFAALAAAGVGLDIAFVQVAAQFLDQPVMVAGKFLFAGNAFSQRPRFSFLGHRQPYQKIANASPWWDTPPGPSTPMEAVVATLASDWALWQGSPAPTAAAVAQG